MNSLFLLATVFVFTGCSSLAYKKHDITARESHEADLKVAEICETNRLIHRLYQRTPSEPITAMATYSKDTQRDIGFFDISKYGPGFLEAARRGADCGPPKMTAGSESRTAIR